MGMEFELKYRANEAVLEEICRSVGGEYVQTPMTTSYYDTPARELTRRRWTLRHRREGERDICTLKTPGINGARGEWEVCCGEIGAAIPELCKRSGVKELGTLAAGGLVMTCGARFVRRSTLLVGEGFRAELALDRGTLFAGERSVDLCEVELELKEGSRAALEGYAARFAARFGLTAEPMSKFARANALARED